MLAAARARRAAGRSRAGGVVSLALRCHCSVGANAVPGMGACTCACACASRALDALCAAGPPAGAAGGEWHGRAADGADGCGFVDELTGEMQAALAPTCAASTWHTAQTDSPGECRSWHEILAHVSFSLPLEEHASLAVAAQRTAESAAASLAALSLHARARASLVQRECAVLPLARPRVQGGAPLLEGISLRTAELATVAGEREGARLLATLGVFALPDALDASQVAAAAASARSRCAAAEDALRKRAAAVGGSTKVDLGAGTHHYAELSSRGVGRWDLLLDTSLEGGDAIDAIAAHGPWVGAVRVALGIPRVQPEGGDAGREEVRASALRWRASVIVSRPGAPAGRWHADGGHSKFAFGGGESAATPYAVCAFVPLVDVAPYEAGGEGVTVFWPGSHRHAGCLHMGSASARELRGATVVPGAPLRAGGAIVYDFRTVHCGKGALASARTLALVSHCRRRCGCSQAGLRAARCR